MASNIQFDTIELPPVCPVTDEPLESAVTLVPCAHKVNESAATRLFGEHCGRFQWRVEGCNQCPLCGKVVEGWMVDQLMRNIVYKIQGRSPPEVGPLYPGNPSRFVYNGGDWKITSHSDPIRRLAFKCSNVDEALITVFQVLGYKDGGVNIVIFFDKKKRNELRGYLQKFGLFLEEEICSFSYESKTPQETKALYQILTKNNEIPEGFSQMLDLIVEKGRTDPF